MKALLKDLLNKAAVINHAEIGIKKEKRIAHQETTDDKTVTPTQEADQLLKKYKKKFMI